MNGLTLSYLADHLDTQFYINVSTPQNRIRTQNMKAAHYSFTLPHDINPINQLSDVSYPEEFNNLCKTQLELDIHGFNPFIIQI